MNRSITSTPIRNEAFRFSIIVRDQEGSWMKNKRLDVLDPTTICSGSGSRKNNIYQQLLSSSIPTQRISNRCFCCLSIIGRSPKGSSTLDRRKFPRNQFVSRSLLLKTSTFSSSSSSTSDPLVPVPQNNGNNNNNNLPGKLIDFQIASKIEGEESNIVTIELYPGDLLRAEAGSMIYMTDGVVSKYHNIERNINKK